MRTEIADEAPKSSRFCVRGCLGYVAVCLLSVVSMGVCGDRAESIRASVENRTSRTLFVRFDGGAWPNAEPQQVASGARVRLDAFGKSTRRIEGPCWARFYGAAKGLRPLAQIDVSKSLGRLDVGTELIVVSETGGHFRAVIFPGRRP